MILDILGLRTPCIQSCLTLGPVTIYSYGVLLAAAYLLGLWLAVRRARAAGIDGNRIMDLLIWVIIAALVGAKALLFVVDFEHFTSSWQEFTTLLRSGGVFYGGLIAAIVVCIWQLRKHRLPLWTSGDLFAPGIALGYMVGRLGCLMAGCCYGKPTDCRVGRDLHRSGGELQRRHAAQRPLHPTQLYESAAGLVILVALLLLEQRAGHFAGRTFWSFVFLYAVLALHHRVLSRRRSRHGLQRALDVAVHLGRARAAQPVHAVVPEPPDGDAGRAG